MTGWTTDIDAAFPPGKPFVPGEIYATTMAEIMDHELNGAVWMASQRFLPVGARR